MNLFGKSLTKSNHPTRPRFVLYVAVLPSYRSECIEIIRKEFGDSIELIVSDAHLDPSVTTGISSEYYKRSAMIRIFGRRAFIQSMPSLSPLLAEAVVLDLNPRSVSAWLILAVRRILRKRTLVWGHVHPQAGIASKTKALRMAMRKLASGTISYTYADRAKAEQDLPGAPVWVAPNALYRLAEMTPGEGAAHSDRDEVIYVGRFAPAKKVDLLVRGFAEAAHENPIIKLHLIGGGEQEPVLRRLVNSLGIENRVTFGGWIEEAASLRAAYSRSFCSVSSGFAGLSLTQSLGFGVPMVVADKENHSPEIELSASGGVHWFSADSAVSLADAILARFKARGGVPDRDVSEFVRKGYSAEAMAAGIIGALRDRPTVGMRDDGIYYD